ncbi:MAG: right-handed parallel beta-helix repeat-containing protein [Ginsengibacter sp.]
MKFLVFLFFTLITSSSYATNYYFSSVSGNDDRTSLQAKTPSSPWKTIDKLNSFFSSLQPGDSILFKRGETFYGSITVNKSGTSHSPIVIGAYSEGNRPVITSLVTIANWTAKGNGIWESYNPSLSSTVNMVLLNGVEQQLGRYPNIDAANNGYLTFESHVDKTSITDNELTSSINWTGAELVMRTRRWVFDRNIITSQASGTLYYTTSSIYEPYDNYGYFIQNNIKTLDKFGEWFYNLSTKKLSVYFGTNNPSSYVIEATTKDNLVSSAKFAYVVFDNLIIKGANGTGFNIKNGSNITIQNCDISFSGQDGVVVNSHTNFKIENCTITNTNNNAVKFGYGVNNSIVRNNKILNTSLIAGMGTTGDANGLAIYTNGDGNVIEYNEIRNTGHIGISFKGNNVSVKNNFIDSFCLTKDDGSGIYSYTNYIAYTGSKVIGNIVLNGIGAIAGTGNSVYSTAGIYIDHNNSKIEITDNTLANCHDYGIYIHNGSNLAIENNTLFNNRKQQLNMNQSPTRQESIRNNIVIRNIFFTKIPGQAILSFNSGADDINLFGKFDSNYYASPLDERIKIYSNGKSLGNAVTENLDLDEWQKKYGKDVASKKITKQIVADKPYSIAMANDDFIKFVYNATRVNKKVTLDGNYIDVKNNGYSNSIVLQPYTSAILLKENKKRL